MTSLDAIAFSLDGRLFSFEAGTGAVPLLGALVHLRDGDRTYAGQIDGLDAAEDGAARGAGVIIGEVTSDRGLDTRTGRPFAHATLSRATTETAALVFGDAATSVRMGTLIDDPSSGAGLLAQRFNRHTFWCGQSGSGKTYALGVLLEQLLVHTRLPLVIFDPNSDFVRMREHRAVDAESPAAAQQAELGGRDIRVLRPSADASDPLRVRFLALPLPAKAAVLRLDPLRDREEYNELVRIETVDPGPRSESIIVRLRERATAAAVALADRIENLRLEDWEVWAYENPAVTEIIDARPDATVLDLGGFDYPEEHLVVALAVLEDLWAKREQRRPVLLVIDEAHNLCSPDTASPLQVAVRERIIQIAAEGRKFGLWLLLSTQRPSKIHPNILSQCDNLALMRMNSPLDLEEIAAVFGFAPRAMVERSPPFRQGEALFAGGFVAAPTMAKMGDRLTVEGGIDVPVPRR